MDEMNLVDDIKQALDTICTKYKVNSTSTYLSMLNIPQEVFDAIDTTEQTVILDDGETFVQKTYFYLDSYFLTFSCKKKS